MDGQQEGGWGGGQEMSFPSDKFALGVMAEWSKVLITVPLPLIV